MLLLEIFTLGKNALVVGGQVTGEAQVKSYLA